MSSQPSWRPNLPESQLFDEKTWLQGTILSAVAYGVTLALFILIISLLSTRLEIDIKHNGRASRLTMFLLTYVCVVFILSTLGVASQAEMAQLSFIDNREFPGGPAAYQELMFAIPISSLGNACFVMTNWFSDSLLLWRCLAVYNDSRTSVWLVMAIPGLMLSTSFVTGTIYLVRRPHASLWPWATTVDIFNLTYLITSVSLGITLTFMIVIRLYLHRRRLTKLLGHSHATHYTSIISMIIESAAIPLVVAFWFLIPFAMGNKLSNIPLLSLVQVQAASSYMIIFRVTQGTAWTSRTADSEFTMPENPGSLSNIRFQTATVEHPPADSLVTSPSRNQFSLDGPRNVLDTESNSCSTDYEISLRDTAGVNTEESVAKYN